MSSPPPTPPLRSRNWTLPIAAGALVLVVVAVVCIGGSLTAYFALRGTNDAPAPTPAPVPSSVPSPSAQAPAPKTGADCVYGDWLETSHVSTAKIYGYNVQLYGKGVLKRIAPDGTLTSIYDNIVRTGTANGDNYEVIHNGKFTMNIVIDADKMHYSNPQVEGTTSWKVNGKTRDTENMRVLLASDTYKCSGDQLRIYGEGESESYSTEYQRIRPPGVPV